MCANDNNKVKTAQNEREIKNKSNDQPAKKKTLIHTQLLPSID